MPQEDYQERLEQRRKRYTELAEKHTAESIARRAEADRMAKFMMDQPILIGHHSEKRHRRDIVRRDNNWTKGREHEKAAEHYAHRAVIAGKTGISSDDPEAVQKLEAKLRLAQSKQETYKAVNKAVKMADTEAGNAKLVTLGLSPEAIAKLRTPDFMGRIGIPSYVLTNNNGNMAQMKKRIAALQTAPVETKAVEVNGVQVVENAEENRVQLIFPGKPDEATRTLLKSYGFRWSPTNAAWQRHLNNAGRFAAQQVTERLTTP